MVTIFRLLKLLVLLIPTFCYGQKEGSNWYFGTNAGITFNNGNPLAITNGKIATNDGCAAISTPKGRILFYTDGVTVWDSTHTVTPNGSGLLGHRSSTQSGIIVPRPDSLGQFYIFTVDYEANSNGLRYSEFNMKLNGGRGDVVASRKNIKLLSPTCEKITSVKHINGINYWVLTHKFNSDTIYAYLVTPSGLNPNPVKSKTGFTISGAIGNTNGYLKASPNGTKIAYANSSLGLAAIGDFNISTGKVSNVWSFNIAASYGIEFSPSSTFLYISSDQAKEIFQYDVSKNNLTDFIASKYNLNIDASGAGLGALQLGPDGKIYIAKVGKSSLSVISMPDLKGVACSLKEDEVSLAGKICFWGLPTFIQSFFIKNKAFYTHNCLGDSTKFNPLITAGIDSMKWDFGDVSSGTNNFSKAQTNVYHIYKKEGNYKVKLVSFFKGLNDTTLIDINIKINKPYIGKDTSFCNKFTYGISPNKDYWGYNWNTGESTHSIVATKLGTYSLKAMDSIGCWASDTIEILPLTGVVKANFILSDTSMCQRGNSFTFSNRSAFFGDAFKSLDWKVWKVSNLNLFASKDSVYKLSFKNSGTHFIQLNVTSMGECMDSVIKKIEVFPNPVAQFSTNENPQIFENHNFSFTNSSKIASGFIKAYDWDLGDGQNESTQNVNSKKYSIDTAINVSLRVISDNNCKDTISQRIYFYVQLVFTMPTAFTPNGDLSNDIFKPVFVGDINQYQLEIFNRWGQKIFSTTNSNDGWNGKFLNRDCEAGMYMCYLEVVSLTGQKITRKETIMLLR